MLPNLQRQWIHLVSCSLEDFFFKPPGNLKQLLHTILSRSRHVTLQGVHSGKQEKKTAQNPMSQFSGHKKNDQCCTCTKEKNRALRAVEERTRHNSMQKINSCLDLLLLLLHKHQICTSNLSLASFGHCSNCKWNQSQFGLNLKDCVFCFFETFAFSFD